MRIILTLLLIVLDSCFVYSQQSSNGNNQFIPPTFDFQTNEVKIGDISYSLEPSEVKSYTSAFSIGDKGEYTANLTKDSVSEAKKLAGIDPLDELNRAAYESYINNKVHPLTDAERTKQTMDMLKVQQKQLFTPGGLFKSYLHQSALFLFWLGAAQVFNCYTDYPSNPMGCFQFLMTETQGIHRASLLAFVVVSGLINTSPWIFGLGKRMLKSDRYTHGFRSTLSLGLGVSAQSVLMTVLQYYLKDENVKKCSRLYILKEVVREEKRWGKSISHDESILENDPCRLAEDRSTITYIKNNLPGEIVSLWATMPILFALETLLHTAVSPEGITVPLLKKLSSMIGTSNTLDKGSKIKLLFSIEKVLTKTEPIYKWAYNFKSKSKIFKVAQIATTPGTWLYSGFNLITFTTIHHKIMPYFNEWHFNNSNNFRDNNTSLQLLSDMSYDSKNTEQFINDPSCNETNQETCEPEASKLLTSLRSDFARWREMKLQPFMITYQGWQEKIQSLIRSFNATKNTYLALANEILNSNAGDSKPWERMTILRGVSPLIPENSEDVELLDDPHKYYGPKSERAFVVGLGLKIFLNLISKELKLDKPVSNSNFNPEFDFNLKKIDKSKKALLLLEEQKTFKEIAQKKKDSLIDYDPRISLITHQGDKLVEDFSDFYNSTMKEVESIHGANIAAEIRKWSVYAKNENFKTWLKNINEIADKLTSGMFLNLKYYPSSWLIHYTTAVKRYVQMPENKDYHRLLIDHDDTESSFSMDEPIKSLGISNELYSILSLVTKSYYKKVLRDSPYLYYLPRGNYKDIQEGIDKFVNIVNYMNHSAEAKVQTDLIFSSIPKLEEWGWISRRSTENFLMLENKFREWVFQHPLSFLSKKTPKITPFIDLIKLTNTIYIGLGSPFSSINEATAYKERFKRYTTTGRNSLFYNFPYSVEKIVTETPFDSIAIGLLCGVDNKNKAYKITQVNDKDSLNVDYEDFFPDSFTPFRLVDAKNPEVIKFCSQTLSKQDTIDEQLPNIMKLIENLIRKHQLNSLDNTIINPKYTSTLVSLYCELNEKVKADYVAFPNANPIKRSGINAEDYHYFQTSTRSWKIIENPWNTIENKICKNGQENTLGEGDLNAIQATALFRWTQELINSLSRDKRDEVLSKYLEFSNNPSQNERIDAFKNLQKIAIIEFLAINGAEYLETVFDNYQDLYNLKLPLLENILVGKDRIEKDKTRKLLANNLDIDLVDYDLKSHTHNKIAVRSGNKLLENSFQENLALAFLQESSYYLGFLSKFILFQLQNNIESPHLKYEMAKVSVFPTNSTNPPIATFLQNFGSVDSKSQALPIAPSFIWRLNTLITSSLALISAGDDEQAFGTLSIAYQLIDYLDIFVFGTNLSKNNYKTEKELNELSKNCKDVLFKSAMQNSSDANKVNSTNESDTNISSSHSTPLNLSYSEKAIVRTWLVHYKNLISDIQGIRGMIRPLSYENAVKNNTY